MKRPEENLPAAVQKVLMRQGLPMGATLVVAVSGGTDLTALLHALAALHTKGEIRLVGAHLNHGLRGAEAEADAEYVTALCARLGVLCRSERCDVPAFRLRRHLSAQAAAREVRHMFLRRIAAEVGAASIALGHTRDDRIETVLLNILRGAGIEGLAGMAVVDPPLLRPLLEVSRAETEAYCALHALNPRHDSSNHKIDYRRNRLRAELLPHLTSYYNQRVGDSLLRLSELAAADSDLLNALAQEALPTVTRAGNDAEWILEAAALAQLPMALQRRVVRAAIVRVRGDLRDVGMEATERVLTALAAGQPAAVTLPGGQMAGVEVVVEKETVRIRRPAPVAQAVPWKYVLDVPARLDLPQAALLLETRLSRSLQEAAEAAPSERNSLCYAAKEIVLPWTVRSWQAGDRLRPRGLGGAKKLQDLFTDRKICGEDRLRYPVLTDATGRVCAVLGLQADETALRLPAPATETPILEDYIVLTWSSQSDSAP